jgi:transcriptional regulator with XRE-family HTH domain
LEVRTVNSVEIGQELRRLRGSRTIQEVADATGLGWSTICMYELGKRRPDDENKVTLAKYYGVSVQQLFYPDTIT